MSISLRLDTSEMTAQIEKIRQSHPNIVKKVVGQTALDMVAAANPTVPHMEGNLRADVFITVLSAIVAEILYNQPYAAYQHEGISRFSGRPLNYTEAGTGAKYLEKQLVDGDRWGKHMAAIHEELINEVK